MDLKLFFSPIPDSVFRDIEDPASVCRSIHIFGDTMPDTKGIDLAIIGVADDAGSARNKGAAKAPDEVRRKLYRLKKGTGAYRIADLGNLRTGPDLDESHMRLQEVCAHLIEKEIVPVIIGGTHDYTYGQYGAYERMDKLVTLLNIDAFLDIEDKSKGVTSDNHLHKLLLYEPNYLFNLYHLAHQSYLIDNKALDVLEKLYFEAYRLGHLRQHMQDMEPVIRDADLMSFDITAIKSSDAPGNKNAQPFGLSGEEACQLCWYAGMNEKLSSAGFYEYNPEADDQYRKTASILATMVWYFIEGFYHRRDACDFRGNDYLRYVVSMPSDPATIVFYKSKFSEKWWLEVPYPSGRFTYERNAIVPCSYKDYQTAVSGEVPDRWINTQAKLI
jgi:formiminoglutamase